MKFKKFIAITVIITMFVFFFGLGIFAVYEQQPEVIIQEKLVEIPFEVCGYNDSSESVLMRGIGVHENNKTGEIVEINISMKPGSGRILFDTTFHSYGTELQDSIPKIIKYAEESTKKSFKFKDISINLYSVAHSIEGTSGGAAMAVGVIALLENKTIKENTIITGTVDERGRIYSIAGLQVKLEVAEEMGFKKALIPQSQCSEGASTEKLEVICVRNISEALEHMLE